MIKANAVALNEMELDMVAGGGFFSELKEMREASKIKEDDSTFCKVVKGTAIVGLVLIAGKFILGRGC